MIDPALLTAGWDVGSAAQVGIEIPVAGYNKMPSNGITDYVLYDAAGAVLAVVEAKKWSSNAHDAKE